jgi:tetratricopeptide (TPR) repeat protein
VADYFYLDARVLSGVVDCVGVTPNYRNGPSEHHGQVFKEPQQQQPQFAPSSSSAVDHETTDETINLYQQGTALMQKGKFAAAVSIFQKCVQIDPAFNGAYENLGYALYRLNQFDQSIEASMSALRLHPDFGPHYNIGLVHAATEIWDKALAHFQQAVYLIDRSSWKDEYTQAYYHLGQSLLKIGQIQETIEKLERDIGRNQASPLNRFELAIDYLWVGKTNAAVKQYETLNSIDPVLATELKKLMKQHAARKKRERGTNSIGRN